MTSRFTLFLRITFLLVGVVFLAEAQAQTTYNVIDRFQLLEDKFRTNEMLREFDHDFIIDIHALANTDVLDFKDDVDQISNAGDSNAQLTQAQIVLREYDKTEQNARIGLGLNIPVFSFEIGGVKIKPSIRAKFNLSFLMGIQTDQLTAADAIQYLGSDIPDSITSKITGCIGGVGAGEDIVQYLITNASSCGLSSTETTLLQAFVGEYFFPSDTTVPDVFNYIKGEGRAGIHFDYTYDKNWFGFLSLYALGRADYSVRVSANSLAGQGEVAELPDELNTTTNMSIDYRLGYRENNFTVFASIEDLKLARMSDNEEEGGSLLYGEDALLRLHGSYKYKLSGFTLKPFAGVHKRSSYDLSDGLYLGADAGAHVFEDKLGVRLRAMIDSEHFTISPMAQLYILHIEYMLKQPITSEIDGVKPTTIHSLNIRIDI